MKHIEKFALKKALSFLLLPCLLLPLLTSCGLAKNTPIQKTGFFFDTVITVTLYGGDTRENEALLSGCMDLAEKYENLFSDTNPDSDISKINAAEGALVHVDPETIKLINIGLAYGSLSEGKFSITCGALTELWDMSEKADEYAEKGDEADISIPSSEEISAALATVGDENVEIWEDTVKLKNPATRLDLGAVAKGYIADRMKEYLLENNVSSAIINLGGNVLTLGDRPDGDKYTIGIQKPFSEDGQAAFTLDISDKSVVTSGNYQRFFKKDGKLYHHILDLTTGYPVESDLTSVTVVTDESVDGDCLSTIFFLMGEDWALDYMETKDLTTHAAFIHSDGRITYSEELKNVLKEI
ncbi:MAG: FAD:protein FMN transferase [Lachnospiraceae bacterium]|nr:FAD:protein FMN transferase [Lachnospiraceae bacterium]